MESNKNYKAHDENSICGEGDIVKIIEKMKKEINPTVVYTHFWDDLNLDHQVVSRAVLTAFRPRTTEKGINIFHFEMLIHVQDRVVL